VVKNSSTDLCPFFAWHTSVVEPNPLLALRHKPWDAACQLLSILQGYKCVYGYESMKTAWVQARELTAISYRHQRARLPLLLVPYSQKEFPLKSHPPLSSAHIW